MEDLPLPAASVSQHAVSALWPSALTRTEHEETAAAAGEPGHIKCSGIASAVAAPHPSSMWQGICITNAATTCARGVPLLSWGSSARHALAGSQAAGSCQCHACMVH